MKELRGFPPLVMLIGPTGAGKSTWAAKHFKKDEIISSDDVRIELGEARGLSRDNLAELFRSVWNLEEEKAKQEYQNRVAFSLRAGKRVVAEATHLRWKDRLSVADLARSAGVAVTYVILNRPLEDKLETAGWRIEIPGLIERQHQMFYDSEAEILAGDGRQDVSIMDTRGRNIIRS